jgi:large subunit ribosomal protein L29
MKMAEIRQMSTTELETKLRELEEELWRLEFRSGTQKLDNPLRLRILKKDIARIKTIPHEVKLGIREEAQ